MSTNSSFDRNTLTGLFLMGLILVLYSLWFPPTPPPNKKPASEPASTRIEAARPADTSVESSTPSP
ncbi:MAG: hypothetical protein ACKO17_01765, partial [Bacteroidota bacterium]